jgi:hypothetical protein
MWVEGDQITEKTETAAMAATGDEKEGPLGDGLCNDG